MHRERHLLLLATVYETIVYSFKNKSTVPNSKHAGMQIVCHLKQNVKWISSVTEMVLLATTLLFLKCLDSENYAIFGIIMKLYEMM